MYITAGICSETTWIATRLRYKKQKRTTSSNNTRHQTAIIYSIPWLQTESRAASNTAQQPTTYSFTATYLGSCAK